MKNYDKNMENKTPAYRLAILHILFSKKDARDCSNYRTIASKVTVQVLQYMDFYHTLNKRYLIFSLDSEKEEALKHLEKGQRVE